MIDLDDEAVVQTADPGGMLAVVGALSEHCRSGYRVGRTASGLPAGEGLTAIAFCGMGGSGVSGDMIRALLVDHSGLPVQVVRGSTLPEFCGPHTLVLCCSYSGETAETLACFDEATRRGCRIVAITSGGELARKAIASGVAVVPVPDGFQPRAALGHLALGSLGALEAIGLVPPLAEDVEETATEVGALAERLAPGRRTTDNRAKEIARAIGDRVPVIWGAEGIGAVAAGRWKAQMNENAKVPAFASALPELDHNEIVGWSEGVGGGFFLIALRHEAETADVAARFPHSVRIAEESGMAVAEVDAAGRSDLARLLSLVTVGDFASVYLALLRGVDPSPTAAIAHLKRTLAEA